MRSARGFRSLRRCGWPLVLLTASCSNAPTESVPDDGTTDDAAVSPDGNVGPDAGDATDQDSGGGVDSTVPPDTGGATDSAMAGDAGQDAIDTGKPAETGATDSATGGDTGSKSDAAVTDGADAADTAPALPTGSDTCALAPALPQASPQRTVTIPLDTTGAAKSIDAPCATDTGGALFFSVAFSRPVVFYADTFGSSFNTVVYLLSSSCAPLTTTTMAGDTLCSDDACGTAQSQVVALLKPGKYVIGVAGHGAGAGAATLHVSWAFAASGIEKQLPKGSSTQTGVTVGTSGNLATLATNCIAAGPDDNYWWTSCPGDPAGTLSASTCGGASWETVLSMQVPGSIPYVCTLDSCGLQSAIATAIPAGAGLRVLTLDGQTVTAAGSYSMTVSRP